MRQRPHRLRRAALSWRNTHPLIADDAVCNKVRHSYVLQRTEFRHRLAPATRGDHARPHGQLFDIGNQLLRAELLSGYV